MAAGCSKPDSALNEKAGNNLEYDSKVLEKFLNAISAAVPLKTLTSTRCSPLLLQHPTQFSLVLLDRPGGRNQQSARNPSQK